MAGLNEAGEVTSSAPRTAHSSGSSRLGQCPGMPPDGVRGLTVHHVSIRAGDVELAPRIIEREYGVLEESVAEISERAGRIPVRPRQEDGGDPAELDMPEHERVDYTLVCVDVAARTHGCPRRRAGERLSKPEHLHRFQVDPERQASACV